MTIRELRRQAIAASLFHPTTLRDAVERMGFVQADPIRVPARAQDLILRHRVKDYRVGDLERNYHRLELEEDRFYAHGFMPQSTWQLLPQRKKRLGALEKRVLEIVLARKRIHPSDLEAYFGRKRTTNAWGGQSKATTHALHHLHRYGYLRVAGRERGVRIYEAVRQDRARLDSGDCSQQIVLMIASILGPISERSLRATLAFLRVHGPALKALRAALPRLIESGALARAMVDGTRYLWPADRALQSKPHEAVRFLCPFDPLVGTVSDSSTFGAGSTASRPTFRLPNANSDTTQCRCSGATT
jgi:uncharacterized protein YcaQ